jgi:outer membrane autotransporter protein
LRTIRLCLAAWLIAAVELVHPALADCVLGGQTVTCSGNATAGFTAGAGVNGLTVNVLTGATVGGPGIALNDANAVTNRGAISVGDSDGTALSAGNNTTITNAGTVALGNSATTGTTLSVGNNAVILNPGTISAGNAFAAVAFGGNASLTNSGLITGGSALTLSGGGATPGSPGLTLNNSGTITSAFGTSLTGVTAIINSGVMSAADNASNVSITGNASSVLNTGRIEAGSNAAAVVIFGDGATVTNPGSIKVADNSVAVEIVGNAGSILNTGSIQSGDSGFGLFASGTSTVTNSGSIRVGNGSWGMGGAGGATVINRGSIVTGQDGTGIKVFGDQTSVLNMGTVTVGAISTFQSTGISGFGNNQTLTNGATGTVTVGDGPPTIVPGPGPGVFGMIIVGDGGRLSNAGTVVVGRSGIALSLQGAGGTYVNSGTVVYGAGGRGILDYFGKQSQIINSGRILPAGSGGNSVYLGDSSTLINSGTIVGSAQGHALFLTDAMSTTVVNSGTIDGPISLNGTTGSTLTNSGLITNSAPWTGVGVQHQIDGTFTQTAAGTLALRVAPAGISDSLAMLNSVPGTGIANLGGTLRALVQQGLYANTTVYSGALTFASSTGRFATVTAGSPFFSAAAVYNAASVDLVLSRIPFNQVQGLGRGSNAYGVGLALEAGYSTNLTGPAVTAYSKLFGATASNTFQQLAGEGAATGINVSFATFSQYFATVFAQMSVGGRGDGKVALLFGGQASDTCAVDGCDAPLPFGGRVTTWAQSFGAGGSVDGDAATGSSRLDISAGGAAFGIDVQLTREARAGVTVGTTSSGYSPGGLSSYGRGQAILFGVYGEYAAGPGYLDAALGYGHGSSDTTRMVSTGSVAELLTASFDGQQYGGRLEVGWHVPVLDKVVVTPFANLLAQAFWQNGYSETARDLSTGGPGALGLTVQGQTTTSVRSTLGAEVRSALVLDDGSVFRPRLRAGWAHEYNPARAVNAALTTLAPASVFTVQGAAAAADAVIVSAGFDLDMTPRVRLFAQFDGDFASNARAFAGTGGVRIAW